jgi:regulator of replication initiation timing
MKKLSSLILTVALVGVLTTTAFAAGQPVGDTSAKTKLTTEQKAQIQAFKAQIQPLKDTLKSNRDQNQALREQNKALHSEIKDKLASLKASETKLSADAKATIKSIRQELAAIRDSGATNGEIKDILSANKTNIKNMDYSAVEAAFKQAYDVQKIRFDKLTQINNKLNELLAAIK